LAPIGLTAGFHLALGGRLLPHTGIALTAQPVFRQLSEFGCCVRNWVHQAALSRTRARRLFGEIGRAGPPLSAHPYSRMDLPFFSQRGPVLSVMIMAPPSSLTRSELPLFASTAAVLRRLDSALHPFFPCVHGEIANPLPALVLFNGFVSGLLPPLPVSGGLLAPLMAIFSNVPLVRTGPHLILSLFCQRRIYSWRSLRGVSVWLFLSRAVFPAAMAPSSTS